MIFVIKNKFILIYIFPPFLSFSAHTEAVRNRGSHSVDLFFAFQKWNMYVSIYVLSDQEKNCFVYLLV